MLKPGSHVRCSIVSREAGSVGEMFRLRARKSGTRPAMYEKQGGSWKPATWQEIYDRARRVASGILKHELERGDRIAILGPTKTQWGVYDLGAQLVGMVTLGIYPKQSPEQIRYILEHSEARIVFVADQSELNAVIQATEGLSSLVAIVPWDEALYEDAKSDDERVTSPRDFEAHLLDEERVDEALAAIDKNETAILVYTSGTTGPPKGAMITHHNILSLLTHQENLIEFFEDDVSLSFLPMAHVAERILAFLGRVNAGFATAYATSVATVLSDLAEVQPTIFGSVPRIYEKAYGKIQSEVEKKPPVVQKLVAKANEVARLAAPYRVEGRPMPLMLKLQWNLFDKILYKKVRGAFGGRVRVSVTGAAPIAREILEFFWGAGLPIYEMYGMTEATVVTHGNQPGQTRLGTVGKLLAPLEHRIADDGEILIKGPYVFRGYYKNPEATAETVIDEWLHTGDIGKLDADGFLSITDRKKHLIITAGGKNLSPANIENAIKNQDALISQVHAHGDARPYVAALISPSPLETLDFGLERGLCTKEDIAARTKELMDNPSGRTEALNEATARIVTHPDFKERVRQAVQRGNKELSQVEKVKRFTILDRDFSQEYGELTPTMKLKRKAVEQQYADLLDRVYTDEGFADEP